jgi:hypothetical protein
LGTFIAGDEYLVRFFNPRKDKWAEHFEILDDASIVGTTDIGQSTVRIFKFNDADRLIFRKKLMTLLLYP